MMSHQSRRTILSLYYPIFVCFTLIELSGSMSRRPQLPKITLKNYVEADSYEEVETSDFTNVKFYENDFVTKNGSEYILSSSAVSVVFVCKASYPVVWKLPNPEHFETINIYEFGLRVTSERVSELTTDLKQPINTEFRSYLKFDNEIYRFRSGYLSCQSVANYHLQSTIYVFAEGQHTLFHSGETFTVNLTQTSSQIILPCRTSRPDISVNLFKEQKRRRNKTEWIPIQQNSSIHFDPRMGFMLDVHTLPDIKGPYKCAVADEEDEEYSLIHVAPGIETPYKFTPISTLESHVNNSLLQVQCCTGKQSSPARGNQRNCATEAECDLIKPLFVHNLLEDPESRLFSNSGDQYNLQHGCYNAYLQNYLHPATILICQGENLKLVGLFLPVYKEGLLNNTDEWNGNYEIMDIANNPPKLQIEKKISFLLESRQEPTWLSQSTSGQRISNHYYPYSEYSSYPEIGFVAGEYSRPNIFAVRSYESIFEGEDIRVTCAPLPYYYAKGGWLQVNWKNGSRMILDTDFDTDAPQHISYIRSHRLQVMDSNSRIRGIINNIDLDVESVDCFSPIWNSAKWDKRTLKLKIQSTALPEFENSLDESLTVNLNATGIQLNCSVVMNANEHFIVTKISWEKDDKMISSWRDSDVGTISTTFVGNISVSSLNLFTISHSTGGSYTCIAANVKGKVMKKFTIYVDDGKSKPTVIIAITVTCISVLLLVTAALVWRVWMMRLKISNGSVSSR